MRTEAKRSVWLWVALLGGCTSGGTPPAPPDVRDSQTPPGEVGRDATEEAAAPDVVDVSAPDQSAMDVPAMDVPAMETTPADVPGMDTPAADAMDAAVADAVDAGDVVAEDVARMDAADGDGASVEDRLDASDVMDVRDADAVTDAPDAADAPLDLLAVSCPITENCSECLATPGCGLCGNDGSPNRCLPGTPRGPIAGGSCMRWIVPGETLQCPVFGSFGSQTRPCSVRRTGEFRECGWAGMVQRACVRGQRYRAGCLNPTAMPGTGELCPPPFVSLGSCFGDSVLRVCPGTVSCPYFDSIEPIRGSLNDHCNRCPMVEFICPPSGMVTLLGGPNDTGASGVNGCEPDITESVP